MKRLSFTVALLGVLAAGCLTNAASSNPAADVTATAYPPVLTPVERQYKLGDPAFEPLPGARAIFGRYEGGLYQIEVPDRWNGEVVYFAHGYHASKPALMVYLPVVRAHLIERGFAVAASSYTQNGYDPGAGARDTYALRDVFEREVGVPDRSYLYGVSMGGHVVAFMLEQYPGEYDGALSACGAVSGVEVLDYFQSWTLLAEYFGGAGLWRLASDGDAFADAIRDDVLPALGAPAALSEAGSDFGDAILRLSGGPRPFFWEGFGQAYQFNFAIITDSLQHPAPANLAAENVDALYDLGPGRETDTAVLNREITRVEAPPEYRDGRRYPEFAPLTGRIAAPFLTLHTTGDVIVPISLERSYRRAVEEAGNGDLLVQRAIRRAGHCAFSQSELSAAFDDLVSWVRDGQRPAGDDLLGDLNDAGLAFTDPREPSDPGTTGLP